ncbi:hypothetical protein C8Q73DRAFT_233954 [Cubamyces lactineus]|nr:hypothetical protein C8Q73DRAFT_233954 [Cubamyces lactineus]
MARTPACRNCSKVKLKCSRPNNDAPCDRCVQADLECQNPENAQPATPAAATTRRSSCDQCRRRRIMCEKQGLGKSCFACQEHGYLCSFVPPSPLYGGSSASAPASPEPAAAPTAQASASTGPRPWVAGPSTHRGAQPMSPNGGPPANDGPSRPDLSCDTSSMAVDPVSSPGASSRANSPRSDFWEVVLAPSPENPEYPDWSP